MAKGDNPHTVMFIGSAGCGKKLLAQNLIMSYESALSVITSSESLKSNLKTIPDDFIFFLDFTNPYSLMLLLDSLNNLPSSHYYGHCCLVVIRYENKDLHAFNPEYLNAIKHQYPFLPVLYSSGDTSVLTDKIAGLIFNKSTNESLLRL